MAPELVLLFTWALAVVALAGLGVTLSRLLGLFDDGAVPSLLLVELLGVATATFALEVWQLWVAASHATAVLVAAGLVGSALGRRELRAVLARADWSAPHLALAGTVTLWLAGRCALPSVNPDDGHYYVQTVRMFREHAIVLGVGNVLGPLAFDNASYLLAAAFGRGDLFDHESAALNGLMALLPLFALTASLARLLRSLRAGATLDPLDVFGAVLLGPFFDACLRPLGSPSADTIVFFWSLSLFLVAARGDAWASRRARSGHVLALTLLCVCGWCLKTALLPSVLAVALATALRLGAREAWALGWRAALMGAATLIPHLVRNVALSGYPLFPSPVAGFPVPWRMPWAEVDRLFRYIWDFARDPRSPTSDGPLPMRSDWPTRFLEREWLNNRGFLIPVVTIAVLLALAVARVRGPAKLPRRPLELAGASAAGLVAWWLAMPDLRFAGALTWALPAALLAAVWPTAERAGRIAAALLVVLLTWGAFWGPEPVVRWPSGWPPVTHNTPASLRSLPGGAQVYDGSREGCWDFPCSPRLSPDLRTLAPGSIESGFSAR